MKQSIYFSNILRDLDDGLTKLNGFERDDLINLGGDACEKDYENVHNTSGFEIDFGVLV